MRLINQKTNRDCGYACIAMVCNITLDKVMKVAKGNYPLAQEEEFELIAHFGYLPTVSTFDHIYSSNTYLVTVPSLNMVGNNHRVVVVSDEDGIRHLYDPQKGRANKKFYTKETMKGYSQVTRITKYHKD